MGYIAKLANKGVMTEARADGARLWERAFGTNKEEGLTQPPTRQSSAIFGTGNSVSQARLVQALRSRSPGGWSDNRYEQAAHYTGITFVSIFRLMRMMGQSEFQVFKKDVTHPDGKRAVTEYDPPDLGFLVRPYDLVELLKKPNVHDSFGKMLSRMTLQKYLTGTSLTWMVPNRLGTPMELYPIETVIAQPQPVINDEFPDGFYRIQPLYPNYVH